MRPIIYAVPFQPATFAIDWSGLDMFWTDCNGVTWDLLSGISGIVMMPGYRGTHMPQITHFKDESPSVAGARWQGFNVPQREVFWPLQVYTDQGSLEWLNLDQKFWGGLNPAGTGVWTVVQPNGTTRSLGIRFTDDGQSTFNYDPSFQGWNNYGLSFQAEQPFWTEDEVSRTFQAVSGGGFYIISDGTTPGVFKISAGRTVSSAKIFNPSDVEVWPKWTLKGPFTAATVGLNGKTITIPFAIADGQSLVIDTAPTAQTAVMDGVNKITSLASAAFAPLPANVTSALSLSATGTGTISVSFTPLYYRAW
jgi:hypothetical protein